MSNESKISLPKVRNKRYDQSNAINTVSKELGINVDDKELSLTKSTQLNNLNAVRDNILRSSVSEIKQVRDLIRIVGGNIDDTVLSVGNNEIISSERELATEYLDELLSIFCDIDCSINLFLEKIEER
ncbi:hypothetical protein [Photobacterium leiognathi]|uniref:hypothetical protein n=1 Tax=Photobacterium leiognathi TaxID=553611 RepID=UPI0029813A55|nr:hypothetical protein [Photobacterium leiognathi]